MSEAAEDPAAINRRRQRELLETSVAAVAVVVGTALVLAGHRWGLALVALAWLAQVLVVRQTVVAGPTEPVLGLRRGGRAIIVAALTLLLASGGGLAAWTAALGGLALLGPLTAERLLARAANFTVPIVSGLPGVEPVRAHRHGGRLAVGVSLAATGLGIALGALALGTAWAPALWLLVAVGATVPAAVIAVTGRARILLARRRRQKVSQAFAAYGPRFVIYTSRPDDASYQVSMWLPYLQRTGYPFCIITRNGEPAEALSRLTDAPVIEARRVSDLDLLLPPSLQAAFYVNASSGNGAFVRYQHLTHVYIGHGDSDKPPSYNPTHAMYDRVFTAGPAAARRYPAHGVSIAAEKFQVVGRPQVEDVRPTERSISDVDSPVVLYAPTWRGHVEETMLYSLPRGEEIVAALLGRGATVIFRPHPFSYQFADDTATVERIQQLLAADAARTGRSHRWGAAAETELGILDCINASDAMVSDVSSVVSDYLFSTKPFAMIAVPAEPAAFVLEYPLARASYVVRGDLVDLGPQLDLMLGSDPLAATRHDLRVDYLGPFPAETYADGFVEAVRGTCVSKGVADVDPEDPVDSEAAEPAGSALADSAADAAGAASDGGVADPQDAEARPAGGPSGRSGSSWWRVYSGLLRAPLGELGAAALATVAVAVEAFGAPTLLTVLIGLAALAAAVVGAGRKRLARDRWPSLLGVADTARIVLAVLALGLWSALLPGLTGWFAVATSVVAVSIVLEQVVALNWGRLGMETVGLPGLPGIESERISRGLLPVVSTLWLALAALGVAPAVLLSGGARIGLGIAVVVLALPVLLVAVIVARTSLVRVRQTLLAEEQLVPALERYAPEFAVYFASTVGASYQIGMWLPYFERIGRPYVVITRTLPMLRDVLALIQHQGVSVPVLFRPSLRSVEDVLVPSLRAAFYVNNAGRNTHLVERRELTHVWLNHGDSEKPACFNPVHAIYDQLFTAGQAGIDRYARHGVTIPADKFRIVGRPQVEVIERAGAPIAEISTPTVLYAPTWQGPFADSKVFSLPIGREIVTQLLARGARVIFRAHPFNYRYPECRRMIEDLGALLDADRTRTGRAHLWGPAAEEAMDVEDCFNASDVMISDVSAVVSDYLKSDKPFAIVSVGRTPEELVEQAPAARAAYVLREDLTNLGEVLDDLLGPDPLATARTRMKVYYLGDFADATYADGFLDAARAVVAPAG